MIVVDFRCLQDDACSPSPALASLEQTLQLGQRDTDLVSAEMFYAARVPADSNLEERTRP